jgi:hypothetical protein
MGRHHILCTLLLVGCSNVTSAGGDDDDQQSSPCGLTLTTAGGTFDPQTCELQLITPGPACDPGPCEQDKTIALRDTDSGHINDVSLFHLVSVEPGTYRAKPADGVAEFNGQVIDAASVVRNLIEGEIVIDFVDGSRASLSLDARFSNNIRVQGTGTLPVVNIAAP